MNLSPTHVLVASLTAVLSCNGAQEPAPIGAPTEGDGGETDAAVTTESSESEGTGTSHGETTSTDDTSASTGSSEASSGEGSTGVPVDDHENIDPSFGQGGTIEPGSCGKSRLGAVICIPSTYDPDRLASPVVWLFSEPLPTWIEVARDDAGIVVDLSEYNDVDAINDKLAETNTLLQSQYNVDRGRFYWAGFSAGGNIVIYLASQLQAQVAGTMVFPGTGGSLAQPFMEAWEGRKLAMFYAVGSEDPNFNPETVETEASYWASLGYETRFELVEGSSHHIEESDVPIRAEAWGWLKFRHLAGGPGR